MAVASRGAAAACAVQPEALSAARCYAGSLCGYNVTLASTGDTVLSVGYSVTQQFVGFSVDTVLHGVTLSCPRMWCCVGVCTRTT